MFAAALVNLALSKEQTGDLPGAAALLERAFALRRAMFGPNSVPYADTAFKLACVLRELGRADGAGGSGKGGWFGGSGGSMARRQQEQWLGLMAEAVNVLEESGAGGDPLRARRRPSCGGPASAAWVCSCQAHCHLAPKFVSSLTHAAAVRVKPPLPRRAPS
jgi:hypothetical protein